MQTSPVTNLLVAIVVGVAGAVAVVIFSSVIADVVGGAVALGALAVVTRSSIQMAGEGATQDDDTASQHP
jgi:hypothetical protein